MGSSCRAVGKLGKPSGWLGREADNSRQALGGGSMHADAACWGREFLAQGAPGGRRGTGSVVARMLYTRLSLWPVAGCSSCLHSARGRAAACVGGRRPPCLPGRERAGEQRAQCGRGTRQQGPGKHCWQLHL